MKTCVALASVGLLLACPVPALAGMPAPLPTNPERVLRLGDTPLARLQAISFFLLAFLLSAAGVQLLWNYVRQDFPTVPRLTYRRAVAGVFLWGLLFVIVLTMISGARELMTPGAWKKQGVVYQLADPPAKPRAADPEAVRRAHLEQLRTALWRFAAMHNGRFPTTDEGTAIPDEVWRVPGAGGLRYQYTPGLSAGHLPELLAWEPELDPERRLVLRANGDILVQRSADIHPPKARGANP